MEENRVPAEEKDAIAEGFVSEKTGDNDFNLEKGVKTDPIPSSEETVPADGTEEKSGAKGKAAVEFFANILRGAAIGVAFIIPGFSGGSVAALLGIYEKLVGAIADLFKHFKRSILLLLPIALGMILGILAFLFPILWGLKSYPIPTVTLFVGLSLGGLPSVFDRVKGGFRWGYLVSAVVALAATVSLAFLPIGREVDLLSLNVPDYFLLVLVGILGSCALVVPGISGSMLLLILGYYTPLVELITKQLLHGANVGHSLLVLGCTGAGVVAGFFAISFLMKFLLKKFPRGTFAAILGFILGSIPLVYVSVVRSYPELSGLYSNPWYWVVAAVMLLFGAALSYLLYHIVKKRGSTSSPKSKEE